MANNTKEMSILISDSTKSEKAERRKMGKNVFGRIKNYPQIGITAVLLFMVIILSFSTDKFMSTGNITNIFRQSAPQIVVAIGMTFVLITGGIDLSVGSIAVLSGTMLAGLIVNNELNTFSAFVAAMVIGIIAGLVNGVIVAKFKIPAFITTLAMMSTARGISLIYSGGYPLSGLPESVMFIGRGYALGIPVPVWFAIAIVMLALITLNLTKFGRYVYAIGGNEEAARLSGVKVDAIKIAVYSISGAMAALTGILYTARLASSQPTLGQGLELDAIAAVVLGGTSLSGGKGSIVGTIIGAVFMAVLGNGLNLLQVSSFWQMAVKGIILILAVLLYEKVGKKK